jgi:hypothetical protein
MAWSPARQNGGQSLPVPSLARVPAQTPREARCGQPAHPGDDQTRDDGDADDAAVVAIDNPEQSARAMPTPITPSATIMASVSPSVAISSAKAMPRRSRPSGRSFGGANPGSALVRRMDKTLRESVCDRPARVVTEAGNDPA